MKTGSIHNKKTKIDQNVETPLDAFVNATNMNKILDFLTYVDNWKKILRILVTCIILLSSYYLYLEIERIDKFKSMNPWDYFQEQTISDSDGLYATIDACRKDLNADVVAVFMYQPQGLHFYRRLETISPKGKYSDYASSEIHTPLYNLSKTLYELKDANLSITTITSDHYDVKLLLALDLTVAYTVPININGVDIGHILFAFKTTPKEIPFDKMRSVAERAKLKIF